MSNIRIGKPFLKLGNWAIGRIQPQPPCQRFERLVKNANAYNRPDVRHGTRTVVFVESDANSFMTALCRVGGVEGGVEAEQRIVHIHQIDTFSLSNIASVCSVLADTSLIFVVERGGVGDFIADCLEESGAQVQRMISGLICTKKSNIGRYLNHAAFQYSQAIAAIESDRLSITERNCKIAPCDLPEPDYSTNPAVLPLWMRTVCMAFSETLTCLEAKEQAHA